MTQLEDQGLTEHLVSPGIHVFRFRIIVGINTHVPGEAAFLSGVNTQTQALINQVCETIENCHQEFSRYQGTRIKRCNSLFEIIPWLRESESEEVNCGCVWEFGGVSHLQKISEGTAGLSVTQNLAH